MAQKLGSPHHLPLGFDPFKSKSCIISTSILEGLAPSKLIKKSIESSREIKVAPGQGAGCEDEIPARFKGCGQTREVMNDGGKSRGGLEFSRLVGEF